MSKDYSSSCHSNCETIGFTIVAICLTLHISHSIMSCALIICSKIYLKIELPNEHRACLLILWRILLEHVNTTHLHLDFI